MTGLGVIQANLLDLGSESKFGYFLSQVKTYMSRDFSGLHL